MTTGQVARLAGVSPRTASKWIDSGELPGYRLPGSLDRRVHRPDFEAFMAGRGLFRAIGTVTLARDGRRFAGAATERGDAVVLRLTDPSLPAGASWDAKPGPGVGGRPDYELIEGDDEVVARLAAAGYVFEDGR